MIDAAVMLGSSGMVRGVYLDIRQSMMGTVLYIRSMENYMEDWYSRSKFSSLERLAIYS